MTQVQVDWLTLLLAPIGVLLLLLGYFTTRSAVKSGEPAPVWSKVVQALGIVCVLVIALLNIVGNR